MKWKAEARLGKALHAGKGTQPWFSFVCKGVKCMEVCLGLLGWQAGG